MATENSKKRLLNVLKNKDWEEARKIIHEGKRRYRSSMEELVTATDSSGQLPLHIAIWKGAPSQLILDLIQASEHTVLSKTKNMSTPLHFATFYASPPSVIEALLKKYPPALDEKNEFGVTPRTYDTCKLDEVSKDMLSKPALFWMKMSVEDSFKTKHNLMKQKWEVEEELEMYKQRCKELETVALQRKKKNAFAVQKNGEDEKQQIELKLQASEAECALLRQRVMALEQEREENRSAAETTERRTHVVEEDDAAGIIVAEKVPPNEVDSMPLPSPSSSSDSAVGGAELLLEKRVKYLEDRLADAIEALDRKISLTGGSMAEQSGEDPEVSPVKSGEGSDTILDDDWVIPNAP